MQNFVVDVGDIAAQRDVVARVLQPTSQNVEHETGSQMSNMGIALNGGTAEVHRYLARHDGFKRTQGP